MKWLLPTVLWSAVRILHSQSPHQTAIMNHTLISTALALLAPAAIAQSCFDGDFGVVIAENDLTLQDTVLPIRPIGFAFPLGGTTYSDIHVSDHGLVYLSNGGVPVPPVSQSIELFTPTPANPFSVEDNEKRLLREALMKARGNRTRAATLLGISRRTLHRKIAQWPELDVVDR